MKYLSVILILIVIGGCKQSGIKDSSADVQQRNVTADEFYKFCETAPCRKDFRVRLKKSEDEYFDRTFEFLPPAIQPMFVSIYSGETVYIEADEGTEGPINLVQVPAIRSPEKTIVFNLVQSDIGNGLGMMLVVKNPFPKVLRYNLGMMPLDSEDLYKTSSCPVMAKGSVFESWPHPIFQIVVGNMRFLKEGESRVCEE